MMKAILASLAFLSISYANLSCKNIPDGAVAVKRFEKTRYLGKWYEVARLDFKQERDLNNVSAEYSLKDNGLIRVLNRGYDTVKKKWVEAEGKAKFRRDENVGELKVSFFGPFYSGYNVLALDKDYRYALVGGKNLKYLWILSRETSVPPEIRNNYLETARQIGYDTSKLIWVKHDRQN